VPDGRKSSSRIAKAALALWEGAEAVLVAVAHPDDAETYFGATMLRRIDRGGRVHIVVATDGRHGCADPAVPPSRVARLRRQEQLEAARRAGVSGVHFLGFTDGELASRPSELKERLVFHIRKLRPRLLCTFDPSLHFSSGGDWTGPIHHPDHRAVGEAALAAVHCGSSLPLYRPDHARRGAAPWTVPEVLLATTGRPNFRFDPRPYLARKRALLEVFRSQGGGAALGGALSSERRFLRLGGRR
jgi:LmbE family N-acetylglucosaminyl deacetylase